MNGVLNKFDYSSDHRLVRLKFILKTNFKKPPVTIKPKINLNFNYDDQKTFLDYNKAIQVTKTEAQKGNDYSRLQNLKKVLISAANQTNLTEKVRSAITQPTRKLIEERESLRTLAQNDLSKKLEYYEMRKCAKKEIRKDVRNFELIRIDEAIRDNKCLKVARQGIT